MSRYQDSVVCISVAPRVPELMCMSLRGQKPTNAMCIREYLGRDIVVGIRAEGSILCVEKDMVKS